METDFAGYPKMPESLSTLMGDEAVARQLHKATWVVTEKVHGANFSVRVTPEGVRFAKRKAWLAPEDDFFAWQLIAPALEQQALELHQLLKSKMAYDRVTIFGELFGGGYPHAEVKQHDIARPIQTGIWYAPDIRFSAFDIAVEQEGEVTYLDFEQALDLWRQSGFFHVWPLAKGNLSTMMQFDTRRDSLVPQALGLPLLEAGNMMEGVVVRPLREVVIPGRKGSTRALFKIKNKEFQEEEAYHQAQAWSFVPETHDDAVQLLLLEVDGLLNANRLQSAISKAGALEATIPGRVEEIRNLILDDVKADLHARHDEWLSQLHMSQREQIWAETMRKINLFLLL